MAMFQRIVIVGAMGEREWNALAKNLPDLVLEGEIIYFEYDPELACFFFNASKAAQKRDWDQGHVLSLADAEAGAWRTIYESPSF